MEKHNAIGARRKREVRGQGQKVRNLEGQPYMLAGGQAVNYWVERYFQIEVELKDLQPFTSEDIDFKGGKEDVKRAIPLKVG